MEMIGDGSLHAIDEPIAFSIVLVSEAGGDHSDVCKLHGRQVLEMAFGPSIDDDWLVTLVAKQYRELVLAIVLGGPQV